MSKDGNLSEKQIYDYCIAIYNYEKFLENFMKNNKYQGYLIDKTTLDKVKTKLQYEKLKPLFDKNELYTEVMKKINKKEKIKYIVPKKHNNSKELINELLNDKQFYLVNQDLLNKLNKEDNYKGKTIEFIMNKEKIKLILNGNDILYFNNNKNGIIEKSSLVQEDSLGNSISPNESEEKISFDKISFKIDLEILIRIFYFNKYLREKENNNFIELKKEENSEIVYLINNSWMEEYKDYFNYKTLEDYLINNHQYTELIIKSKYYLSRETIKQLIENLPSEYINNINKKEKFDKNKTFNYEKKDGREIVYLINNSWMEEYKSFFEYKDLENYLKNKNKYPPEEPMEKIIKNLPQEYIDKINKIDKNNFDKTKTCVYETNKFNDNINYYYNNNIINVEIYDLLKELGYKVIDSLIKLDLYFIGSNKILLFFPNKNDINEYRDEIGIINEKGLFIPEFIIDYNKKDISPDNLNNFIKYNLMNFSKRMDIKNLEIINNKKEKIGDCFKLINNNSKNINNNTTNNNKAESDNNLPEEIETDSNINKNKNENNTQPQDTLNISSQQENNNNNNDKVNTNNNLNEQKNNSNVNSNNSGNNSKNPSNNAISGDNVTPVNYGTPGIISTPVNNGAPVNNGTPGMISISGNNIGADNNYLHIPDDNSNNN